MKTKDKKLRNKRRKSLARYGIEWKPDEKGYQKAHAYRKPDTIETPLKESAKAMSSVFKHTYQDHPVPELSKKEQRKRAEVVPIGKAQKLHSVTNDPTRASPEELAAEIAALESHIDATTSDKECEFIGPPKPELSLVPSVSKVEAVGKATPEQPVHSHKSANDSSLHSVTTHHNGDYNYEELAERCDLYQIEIMQLKVGHEQRVGILNDHISQLSKALTDADSAASMKGFLEAHTSTEAEDRMRKRITLQRDTITAMEDKMFKMYQELRLVKDKFEDVQKFNNALVLQKNNADVETGYGYNRIQVLEMAEDYEFLRQENSDLRKEIDLLMYTVDQHNKNYQASNVGQTSLVTLANQFNIYMSQHRDDPIRNFLRRSNYSIGQAGALRNYFDKECDTRVLLSEERNVFRHWAKREYKKLRWSVRTRNEIRALRQIGTNTARYRKVEIPDQHCKVFAKLHSVTDVGASNVYDVRLRPLASSIDADAYCKVWSEFKAVTPRCEYEQQREQERKEAVLASVKGSPVFKVVKSALVATRAVKSVLNYELSSKKRNESMRIAMLEAKRKEEEASSIKRMREEEFEQSINKEVLRRRMLGLPDHV